MSFRPSTDPMGGPAPLVDKMIGTSYDVVLHVSKNLELIQYVADHMEELLSLASNQLATKTVTGVAGQLGELVSILLPTGVQQSTLVSSSVLLVSSTGAIYDAEHFSTYVEDTSLKFSLKLTAPTSLIGAEIRWHVTYEA